MAEREVLRTPSGTAYEIAGQGDPIVFLHGVGLDRHMWFAQRDVLSKTHKVITFDLLNHGESPTIPKEASLHHWTGQVDRLLDELKLNKPTIVGFSFGVPITLAYTLNHISRVRSIVLLNGVYNRTPEEASGVRTRYEEAIKNGPGILIDAAIDRWFSPKYQDNNPDVIAYVRERLESNDPKAFLAAYGTFAHHDALIAGRIRTITCPALVMTGALDPGSTPELSERMASELPDARLFIHTGQRHMMPLEGAQEVNERLQEFL